MKPFIMLLCVGLSAILLSFTHGGDSYTIHLNNKLVVEHHVSNKALRPSLTLTAADKNGQLSVYYSECGKIGKARTLVLKDEQQKVLKTWRFADAVNEHTPMIINTNDIIGLIKNEKVNLYYSSHEVSREQLLVSIVPAATSARRQ